MRKKINDFHFIKILKKILDDIKKSKILYKPTYRISEIFQNEDEQYIIKVQTIQKNIFFNAYPEEILAKDHLVDCFSPRDIRTLTYLGYLDINAPKYKILAQRLSEKDGKLFFALKKTGNKSIITKSVSEILSEEKIVNSLKPQDAKIIGFALAQESFLLEKTQKNQFHILEK